MSEAAVGAELCVSASSPEIAGGLDRASIASATDSKARRGPCMSRRTGQRGSVFQKGTSTWSRSVPAYGKFWIDTPEGRKRKTISLGVCHTRSVAKQKLREYIEASGTNSAETFVAATAPALTFRKQAEIYMDSLAKRRRKPIKPATLSVWASNLNKWILPILGDMALSEVGNAAMKQFVDKCTVAELAPKSIVSYCAVVKLVVASAVNEEGEKIYKRTWNHEFIGLPIVDNSKLRRPTLTANEVTTVISNANERYAVLFALLAGTGLRIGEALALKTTNIALDGKTISVERSMWNGQEQDPKTPNAVRIVDVPETLASMLREFVAGKNGYLFTTRSGRPMTQRCVLSALHEVAGKAGLHSFRRFRTSVLRKSRVPDDLTKLWLGHADSSITDGYARQLREDVSFRQEWAEKCGLGFQLVHVGPPAVAGFAAVEAA
jgi:integrase